MFECHWDYVLICLHFVFFPGTIQALGIQLFSPAKTYFEKSPFEKKKLTSQNCASLSKKNDATEECMEALFKNSVNVHDVEVVDTNKQSLYLFLMSFIPT